MASFTPDFSGALNSFSTAAGNAGQASADLLNAQGDDLEATAYGRAATIALQNKQLQALSTNIQEAATSRDIYKTIGGERATVAGNGLRESGNALDIISDSTKQGALQKQLTQTQGDIQENAYEEQAASYTGLQGSAQSAAAAARASATASKASSGLNIIGGVLHLFGL